MKPDRATLERMYVDERRSSRAIAADLGVSKVSVIRWLREYNLSVRPKGVGLDARGQKPPTADELYRMLHVEQREYRSIAAQYGVTHRAVILWARRCGIESPLTRNARMSQRSLPSAEELRELYEAGLSMRVIGGLYGVDKTVIRRLCDQHSIDVRYGGWDGGKRYGCADGHMVKSSYEMQVDDWLSQHGVEHVYEPAMPGNPRYRADFLANGWYIEVWGTSGVQEYNKRRNKKRSLYHAHHIPLIEIGLHAFYPKGSDLWSRRLAACLTTAPVQGLQLGLDFL